MTFKKGLPRLPSRTFARLSSRFLLIFLSPFPSTSPSRATESPMLLPLSDPGEGLLVFLAKSNATFKTSNCILVNTLWLSHSGDMITIGGGLFPKFSGFALAGGGGALPVEDRAHRGPTGVAFTHQPPLRGEASWFSCCSRSPTAGVMPWLCPAHEPQAAQQALPTSCSRVQPQRTLTPGSEVRGTPGTIVRPPAQIPHSGRPTLSQLCSEPWATSPTPGLWDSTGLTGHLCIKWRWLSVG